MRQFIPPFLQKIDHYLLLNQPSIWATQIHKLIYGLLLYTAALLLLSCIFPVLHYDLNLVDSLNIIFSVPALIIFIYWIRGITRYNLRTQFGISTFTDALTEILILLGGIFLIVCTVFVLSTALHVRKANYVSKVQMVEDLNHLNAGFIYFMDEDDAYTSALLDFYQKQDVANPEIDLGILPYYIDTKYGQEFLPLYTQQQVKTLLHKAHKSKDFQASLIENYIQTYNKYSDKPISINKERVMQRFENMLQKRLSNAHTNPNTFVLNIEERKPLDEMQDILAAKDNLGDYFNGFFISYYFWWMTILTIAILVWIRVGIRDFLIAIVLGFLFLIGSFGLLSILSLDDNHYPSAFLLLWSLGFFVYFILTSAKSRQLSRKILLSILALASPFLLPSLIEFQEGNLLSLSQISVLLLWVFLFDKQFLITQSIPKRT